MTRYQGSCHCGRIRFRVDGDLAQAILCNCAICTMKGFIHLIVPPEQFHLDAGGDDDLMIYRFNTGIAKHQFCRHCGIHPFYVPRSDPDKIDVNVRCLQVAGDGTSVDLTQLRPIPFDGKHWEQAMADRD
jgi:hypothetical protein